MTLPVNMGGPHYVVVTEDDGSGNREPPDGWLDFHSLLDGRTVDQRIYGYEHGRHTGPLAGETYLGLNTSSYDAACAQVVRLGARYGEVRIARLVFSGELGFGLSVAAKHLILSLLRHHARISDSPYAESVIDEVRALP